MNKHIRRWEQWSHLRWSRLGRFLFLPISNRFWHVGPLDPDDWVERRMWGTPVRIYGPSRRRWFTVARGTGQVWEENRIEANTFTASNQSTWTITSATGVPVWHNNRTS